MIRSDAHRTSEDEILGRKSRWDEIAQAW